MLRYSSKIDILEAKAFVGDRKFGWPRIIQGRTARQLTLAEMYSCHESFNGRNEMRW